MDTTNVPATSPAGDGIEAQAGAPGPEEDLVTLADVVEEGAGDPDAPDDDGEGGETAGTGDAGTGEAGTGENGTGEAGDKPKRKSGSARLKERVRLLERLLAGAQQERQAQLAPAFDPGDDLAEPRERDFPNDYLAYDRALREYQTRRAIRDEQRRVARVEALRHAESEHRARLAGYGARLDEVRDRIADFDRVMAAAGSVDVRNDLRDLILDSPKGPLLAYYLAKNPDRIAELNRMPPWAAAKEIGSLEARIRGHNPKTVTRAKAPPQTPRGGTAVRGANPGEMSMADYIAARKAGTI